VLRGEFQIEAVLVDSATALARSDSGRLALGDIS